jgi:hypothetical protein
MSCGETAPQLRQEGRALAAAHLVHGLRGELLAGARLAHQQHGRRGRRDAAELIVELLHRRARAEQVAVAPELSQLLAQLADLGAQLASARHAPQHRAQPLDVHRLHHVIGGAQAQRLHGALDARVTGDQHHLGRLARLEVVDQLDALTVGQLQVGEQHIGLQARHVNARGAQRVGLRYREALAFGELAEPLQRFGVVIYEQQMRHVFFLREK